MEDRAPQPTKDESPRWGMRELGLRSSSSREEGIGTRIDRIKGGEYCRQERLTKKDAGKKGLNTRRFSLQ